MPFAWDGHQIVASQPTMTETGPGRAEANVTGFALFAPPPGHVAGDWYSTEVQTRRSVLTSVSRSSNGGVPVAAR